MLSPIEKDIKTAQKIYLKCRQLKEDIQYIRKLAEESNLNIHYEIKLMANANHAIHDKARNREREIDPNQVDHADALRDQALMRGKDY